MFSYLKNSATILLGALLVIGIPINLSGQIRTAEKTKQEVPRRQARLKNPEAAGLLLNLMAR